MLFAQTYSDAMVREDLGITKPVLEKLRKILRDKGLLQSRQQIDDVALGLLRAAKKHRENGVFNWINAIEKAMLEREIIKLRQVVIPISGSSHERTYQMLSQFGDDYFNAVKAANDVGEFFRKINSHSTVWNMITDVFFQAAAYQIACTKDQI